MSRVGYWQLGLGWFKSRDCAFFPPSPLAGCEDQLGYHMWTV